MRILLVEDEAPLRETLAARLKREGYAVDTAADGEEGLYLGREVPFDVAIIDLGLPKKTGMELINDLRAAGQRCPILILTARSSWQDKVQGLKQGADDYLVKPFEFRELLLKMRVLLKRTLNPQFPVGNILKAADLSMNLDSKEVFRANQKIKLTAKEFQLLEFLLRNKNRVVSRASLAINVWDIDFDTNTNVIDVYISYVRNKVDKNFEQKLIQTHVGMGYVLKDHF